MLRENDGLAKDPNIRVLLASAALNSAVDIELEVDPDGTAVPGLHYNLLSNTVSIPAGEFSAPVNIEVLPDNIEAGERLTLILKIANASVDINTSLDSAGHILQISCPPNIPTDGTWFGQTTAGTFGVSGTRTGVQISKDPDDLITYGITDVTAGFLENFGCCGGILYPAVFTNICDAIVVTSTTSNIGSILTNEAAGWGSGSWDPTTETLTVPWYNASNDFGEISVFTRE